MEEEDVPLITTLCESHQIFVLLLVENCCVISIYFVSQLGAERVDHIIESAVLHPSLGEVKVLGRIHAGLTVTKELGLLYQGNHVGFELVYALGGLALSQCKLAETVSVGPLDLSMRRENRIHKRNFLSQMLDIEGLDGHQRWPLSIDQKQLFVAKHDIFYFPVSLESLTNSVGHIDLINMY